MCSFCIFIQEKIGIYECFLVFCDPCLLQALLRFILPKNEIPVRRIILRVPGLKRPLMFLRIYVRFNEKTIGREIWKMT